MEPDKLWVEICEETVKMKEQSKTNWMPEQLVKNAKKRQEFRARKINLTNNFRDMLEDKRKSIIMVPVKTLKMEITWETKLFKKSQKFQY